MTYKQQHSDCNVSETLGDSKKLSMWVSKQRNQFKNQVKGYQAGKSSDRYIALNEMGSIFNLNNQVWSIMYEQLVAYKQQHGDN